MGRVQYDIPYSLIFHSTELIARNDDVSIGQLSEEALESCNKDVRNYREFLSRKCGHVLNLTDTFNHLFERSDPHGGGNRTTKFSQTQSANKIENNCVNGRRYYC
jgi:hypothetical protein